MQTFESKIEEVKNHFYQKDFHLGFRRLVDCVLETKNPTAYQSCIELNEWKETNQPDETTLMTRCTVYLDDLKKFNVQAVNTAIVLAKVVDVMKIYNRGNFKLGKINLAINYGDVWGLVGENGNGKTTLLRILAKDLSFNEGTIEYNQTIDAPDDYALRTHLIYIPQRTPKWHGSLKTNLKFAATHYGIKGDENELLVMMMIIRFGLYPFRNHNWSELSSGYKMRFELARTFLRRPKLLLLDEPLANLDVLSQQIVLEDLKYMAKSISNPLGIILSSQQLFEVEKVSNKIIFLKNGAPTLLHEQLLTTDTTLSNVIELETDVDRINLEAALQSLSVKQINYNGGQYIIEYEHEEGMKAILLLLINNNIRIKYVRDISTSSRRLFN